MLCVWNVRPLFHLVIDYKSIVASISSQTCDECVSKLASESIFEGLIMHAYIVMGNLAQKMPINGRP